MKVSEETVKEWKELKERGDNAELAKILNLSPQNVSKITNTGEGSFRQIRLVTRFFNKRKQDISKLMDDNN